MVMRFTQAGIPVAKVVVVPEAGVIAVPVTIFVLTPCTAAVPVPAGNDIVLVPATAGAAMLIDPDVLPYSVRLPPAMASIVPAATVVVAMPTLPVLVILISSVAPPAVLNVRAPPVPTEMLAVLVV